MIVTLQQCCDLMGGHLPPRLDENDPKSVLAVRGYLRILGERLAEHFDESALTSFWLLAGEGPDEVIDLENALCDYERRTRTGRYSHYAERAQ